MPMGKKHEWITVALFALVLCAIAQGCGGDITEANYPDAGMADQGGLTVPVADGGSCCYPIGYAGCELHTFPDCH